MSEEYRKKVSTHFSARLQDSILVIGGCCTACATLQKVKSRKTRLEDRTRRHHITQQSGEEVVIVIFLLYSAYTFSLNSLTETEGLFWGCAVTARKVGAHIKDSTGPAGLNEITLLQS